MLPTLCQQFGEGHFLFQHDCKVVFMCSSCVLIPTHYKTTLNPVTFSSVVHLRAKCIMPGKKPWKKWDFLVWEGATHFWTDKYVFFDSVLKDVFLQRLHFKRNHSETLVSVWKDRLLSWIGVTFHSVSLFLISTEVCVSYEYSRILFKFWPALRTWFTHTYQ